VAADLASVIERLRENVEGAADIDLGIGRLREMSSGTSDACRGIGHDRKNITAGVEIESRYRGCACLEADRQSSQSEP
jgi:hypothetical protein